MLVHIGIDLRTVGIPITLYLLNRSFDNEAGRFRHAFNRQMQSFVRGRWRSHYQGSQRNEDSAEGCFQLSHVSSKLTVTTAASKQISNQTTRWSEFVSRA